MMPASAEAILNQLGVPAEGRVWDALGYCAEGSWKTTAGAPLFPRIDLKTELEELDKAAEAARKAALPAVEVEPLSMESVDFDTFCKSDLPRRQGQGLRERQKERQAPEVHPG